MNDGIYCLIGKATLSVEEAAISHRKPFDKTCFDDCEHRYECSLAADKQDAEKRSDTG
jgi:hypothetical protein